MSRCNKKEKEYLLGIKPKRYTENIFIDGTHNITVSLKGLIMFRWINKKLKLYNLGITPARVLLDKFITNDNVTPDDPQL